MGKRKQQELNEIDKFVIRAREMGLRYAQLQVIETCEMLKRQEERRKREDKTSL